MSEAMTNILWRRLKYMLTPQFDLYRSIAGQLHDKHVLEIGFGTGFGTVQLAQYAARVAALEPDLDAVLFARQVLPLPAIAWLHADVTELYPQPIYDAAVMVETLEHITAWQKALSNIYGMLKPGGALYMTARNRNADLRRNDLHEREWSSQELTAALSELWLDVKLFDYTLTEELPPDTHVTPLIAVARKAGGDGKDTRSDVSARRLEGAAQQASA